MVEQVSESTNAADYYVTDQLGSMRGLTTRPAMSEAGAEATVVAGWMAVRPLTFGGEHGPPLGYLAVRRERPAQLRTGRPPVMLSVSSHNDRTPPLL